MLPASTWKKMFLCLGLRTQHINTWALATRSGDPILTQTVTRQNCLCLWFTAFAHLCESFRLSFALRLLPTRECISRLAWAVSISNCCIRVCMSCSSSDWQPQQWAEHFDFINSPLPNSHRCPTHQLQGSVNCGFQTVVGDSRWSRGQIEVKKRLQSGNLVNEARRRRDMVP